METKTAEAIAVGRNAQVLRVLADAERTIARNHTRRGANALAAVHERAAEQLTELLGTLYRSYAIGTRARLSEGAEKWSAEVITHPKVAAFTHIDLRGPELDDHDRDLIERLASDVFDEFCDFVAARNALKLALSESGEPSQYDLDRVGDTWDALSGEIDSGLLLRPAESRLAAEALDEACGRVGTGERAA